MNAADVRRVYYALDREADNLRARLKEWPSTSGDAALITLRALACAALALARDLEDNPDAEPEPDSV